MNQCNILAQKSDAINIEKHQNYKRKGSRKLLSKSITKRGAKNVENKIARGKTLGTSRGALSPQNTTIKKTSCGALQKNNLKEERLQKVNLQITQKTYCGALQKNNLKEDQLQKVNLQRNKTLDVF